MLKVAKSKITNLEIIFDISLFLYLFTHTALAWDSAYTTIRHLTTLLYFMISACYCVRTLHKLFKADIYLLWHLAFVFLCALSIMWAQNPERVIGLLSSMLMTVLIIYPIWVRTNTGKDIIRLIQILIWTAALCGLYAIAISPLESLGRDRLGNQANINPNLLAIPCSFAAVLNFFYLHFNKVTKGGYKKLSVLTLICLSLTVILTGSKTGILILFLGIMVYIFFAIYNYQKPIFIMLAFISCILLVLLVLNNSVLRRLFLDTFVSLINTLLGRKGYIDISSSERLNMIHDAMILFKKSPLWGWGLDNYAELTQWNVYSHNNYTEIMSGLGIIGLFFYNWLPFILLAKYLVNKKANHIFRCIGITLCTLFFILQISNVCYSTVTAYVYILIAYKIQHLEVVSPNSW